MRIPTKTGLLESFARLSVSTPYVMLWIVFTLYFLINVVEVFRSGHKARICPVETGQVKPVLALPSVWHCLCVQCHSVCFVCVYGVYCMYFVLLFRRLCIDRDTVRDT